MNGNGEQWVVVSAVTVLGIYAYRRLTEAASGPFTVKGALGLTNPLPVASFITAWGFVFLVISLMETVDDGLGGAFALLVMTADFLANAPALFKTGSALSGSQDTATGTQPYTVPPGVKVAG